MPLQDLFFKFLSNCCKCEKIKAVIFDLGILYFLPYSSNLLELSFILKYIAEKCRSCCNLLNTCDKYLSYGFHHRPAVVNSNYNIILKLLCNIFKFPTLSSYYVKLLVNLINASLPFSSVLYTPAHSST